MKTITNNNRTSKVAAAICLALIFGASAWAQPNADSNTFWAYKPDQSSADYTIQTVKSDNDMESTVEGRDHSTSGLQKISINKFFFDMKNQQVRGNDAFESELNRRDRLIEKYGREIGLDIFDRKLWMGMTTEMVYESIGEPADVYVHEDGVHVHWAYWLYDIYLCFENSILVSYQD